MVDGDRLAAALKSLLDKGYGLSIGNQAKRITLPSGERDFVARVCYTVMIPNKQDHECRWEGFEDADEALMDLVAYVEADN